MNRNRLAAFLGSLLLATSAAFAGTITTTFSGGNNNAIGGTVFFNLDVLAVSGITITAVDTNVGSESRTGILGNPVSLSVYTRSGTFSGAETTAAAWAFVSSGVGTAAGLNAPTPVDLSDFYLPQGSYGIAIVNQNFAAIYTNTSVGQLPYGSADAMIAAAGAGVNGAFTGGGVFSPRTWNGTVYYTLGKLEPIQPIQTPSPVPDAGGTALLFAGALAGLFALRRLR